MIDWRRRFIADGVVLYPPQGRDAAYVRVRERVRPLRWLRDIRAAQVAASRPARNVVLGAVTRLVTEEGEHAVTYTISGETDTGTLDLAVGLIFGDDWYTSIESLCTAPELTATLRQATEQLTRTLPLGLGTGRRRRYLYTPPPDWQGVVRPHGVSWYPRDFPRRRASIHVFDAMPAKATAGIILTRRVFDEPTEWLKTLADVSSFQLTTDCLVGSGELVRGTAYDDVSSAIIRVTLEDSVYAYYLRLEAAEPHVEDSRVVFDTLLKTIRPVPSAAAPPAPAREASIHWAE